jgi:hypothetical protein
LKGIRKMADRIFPSAKQASLGNEKQINTIDWDVFAKNFKFAAEEDEEKDEETKPEGDEDSEDEDAEEAPESEEEDDEDEGDEDEDESDEDDEDKKEPKEGKMKDLTDHFKKNPGKLDRLKGGLKDYMEKKLHGDKDAKVVRAKDVMCEKCAGKGCSACWDMKKKASTEGRVIVFNSPSEISAEALMVAKTAGDDVKVRAILAARETRNKVIEAKLESLAQDEVAKAQKLAQRREAREAIIAQADASVQRVASTDAKIVKSNKQEGFKTVSAMQNEEKMIVAQRLLDNGFPKEYVEATLGLTPAVETVVTAEETQIREIMASSLNDSTKRTAVASFVKVAELSQEQLDRCIRFWVDELGYGDEEWVRDLFAKK